MLLFFTELCCWSSTKVKYCDVVDASPGDFGVNHVLIDNQIVCVSKGQINLINEPQ